MTVGNRLKQAREDRAMSLTDIANRTRIAPRVLRAIERDDFETVPGGIFVRGYLRSYAAEVGLDPKSVLDQYLDEHEAAPAIVQAPSAEGSGRASQPVSWRFPHAPATLAVGIVAIVAIVLLVAYFRSPARPDAAPAAPARGEQTGSSVDRAMAPGSSGVVPATKTEPPAADAVDDVATPLRVGLTATGAVWVAGEADGKRVLYRLLAADEKVSLSASSRIRIRIGNAGALQVRLDDQPAPPVGGPGEVRTVEYVRRANGSIERRVYAQQRQVGG